MGQSFAIWKPLCRAKNLLELLSDDGPALAALCAKNRGAGPGAVKRELEEIDF